MIPRGAALDVARVRGERRVAFVLASPALVVTSERSHVSGTWEDSMSSAISRRELIRRGGGLGGLLAVPALAAGELRPDSISSAGQSNAAARAAAGTGLRAGHDVYQSIGVRPLINARGTFTIISGSTMLPEVRAAIDAASRSATSTSTSWPRRSARAWPS